MKIKKEIELTIEEMRKVADQYQNMSRCEDIMLRIEELKEKGDLDLDLEFDEEEIQQIYEKFEYSISRHDLYWDCYWATIEESIKEVIKEISCSFKFILHLKLTCLKYEQIFGTSKFNEVENQWMSKVKEASSALELGSQIRELHDFLASKIKEAIGDEEYLKWAQAPEIFISLDYKDQFTYEIPNTQIINAVLEKTSIFLKMSKPSNFEIKLDYFENFSLFFEDMYEVSNFLSKGEVELATVYKRIETNPESEDYGKEVNREILSYPF